MIRILTFYEWFQIHIYTHTHVLSMLEININHQHIMLCRQSYLGSCAYGLCQRATFLFKGVLVTCNVYQRRLQIWGFSGFTLGAVAENNLNNLVQPSRYEDAAAACACCEILFRDRKFISPDCTEQFEVPYPEWHKQIALLSWNPRCFFRVSGL